MALATLHIAAIPVVAGLLAGTGAVTAYVASPAQTAAQVTAAAPVATQTSRPCAEQTWPYIEQKCMPASATGKRTVRLVAAPRGSEAAGDANSNAVSSSASAAAARAAEPSLTTSDTVLRQPQQLATKEPNAQVAKPRAKRETRRQRERLVVRPLRLEAFR